MKLEFIGVGEAFEPKLGNASYLLHSETKLLVDCGYAVPRNFFSKGYPPDFVDAIYITHFHADHFFGIPALVTRWHEDGRKKPLRIIGQPGTETHINQAIDLGYPNCRSKLPFALHYQESTSPLKLNELNLSFAPTDHLMKNYAITIAKENLSIGISGDGGLTDETGDLFKNCRLLIHETYKYDQTILGHTCALELVDFAKTLPRLLTLALVHIQRDERVSRSEAFKALQKDVPFNLMIPGPGDEISLEPFR